MSHRWGGEESQMGIELVPDVSEDQGRAIEHNQ